MLIMYVIILQYIQILNHYYIRETNAICQLYLSLKKKKNCKKKAVRKGNLIFLKVSFFFLLV